VTLADERARQQENTNFDLNRRASLRLYLWEPDRATASGDPVLGVPRAYLPKADLAQASTSGAQRDIRQNSAVR
jgi:hypothetical protein